MVRFASALTLIVAILPSFALAATARTSPPSGAYIVRQTGTKSGEYATIGAAVKAIGAGTNAVKIFVYSGTYKEQVLIDRVGKVDLFGYTTDIASYSKNEVTISASVLASVAGSNDASGTLRVKKNDFAMYSINVANTAGNNGQAIALSAYGLRQGYYAVQLLGYQDTVLTNTGTHYFGHSFIEGATDYIFGRSSAAVFNKVVFNSIGPGWLAANGRDAADSGGYLLHGCTIQLGSKATPPASADASKYYLGRPWKLYSRVKIQNSVIGSFINPVGWTPWDSASSTANVQFSEYGNTGAGAATSKRASFVKIDKTLTTFESMIGSDYKSWVDGSFL